MNLLKIRALAKKRPDFLFCSLYAAAATFLHSVFFTKSGTDFIMDKYAVGYSARSERLKRKGAIL